MSRKLVKVFDDLEPFEARFQGTFCYDAEQGGRVYSGQGRIFNDQILYSIHFVRKKIAKSTYSDTPTHIRGYLQYKDEQYRLTDVKMDRVADEFLFTFTNGDKAIQLDCEITDFKFRCEFLGK